jgi:PHP family Zn ribbon phosphoesterase
VAIASHVDREGFGILGQLGLIPESLPLDALEISWHQTSAQARKTFPQLADWPLVQGSDAHRPEEVGRGWTQLVMAAISSKEFRMALRGDGGRWVKGRED